jgi:hypothetical protein
MVANPKALNHPKFHAYSTGSAHRPAHRDDDGAQLPRLGHPPCCRDGHPNFTCTSAGGAPAPVTCALSKRCEHAVSYEAAGSLCGSALSHIGILQLHSAMTFPFQCGILSLVDRNVRGRLRKGGKECETAPVAEIRRRSVFRWPEAERAAVMAVGDQAEVAGRR